MERIGKQFNISIGSAQNLAEVAKEFSIPQYKLLDAILQDRAHLIATGRSYLYAKLNQVTELQGDDTSAVSPGVSPGVNLSGDDTGNGDLPQTCSTKQ